jgi:hypothetical protein
MKKKRATKPKNIEITFEVMPLRKTMTMPDLGFDLEVAVCKQFYKQGIEDLINDVGGVGFNPCATISIVRSDGATDGHGYAGDFKLEEIEEPDLFCQQPNYEVKSAVNDSDFRQLVMEEVNELETPPEWTEDNYEHELMKEDAND